MCSEKVKRGEMKVFAMDAKAKVRIFIGYVVTVRIWAKILDLIT
jgi:hypothetical protein